MEILFYDNDLAVCVKPVGLDSEAQVPAELKKALGGEIFPVHRLDKNVGGVMVYARTKQAAATLSRAVQDGAMVKEYVAMVHGLPPESGDWEDLILWEHEPINSTHLVELCRERLGWSKATTYTVIRRLSERGVVKNENAVVTALVSKEQAQASRLDEMVEETFQGSMPAFIAAFSRSRKLTRDEVEQLKALIDNYEEDRT